MRKLSIILAALAVSIVGMTGQASAAPRPEADKITICHRDNGKPGYKAITINQNALSAHLAHGDIYPVPVGGCPTGGGNYPPQRATVAPSSSVVQENAPFSVTAKYFCPGTVITIKLISSSKTYTRTVTASASGMGSVSFNPPTVKPGIYRIVATSPSSCGRSAESIVQVRDRRCRDDRSSTSSGARDDDDDDDDCRSENFSVSGLRSGNDPTGIAGLIASLSAVSAAKPLQSSAALSNAAPGVTGSSPLPAPSPNSVSMLQLASVVVAGAIGTVLVGRLRRRALRPATITS